jgi:hypothetical protein
MRKGQDHAEYLQGIFDETHHMNACAIKAFTKHSLQYGPNSQFKVDILSEQLHYNNRNTTNTTLGRFPYSAQQGCRDKIRRNDHNKRSCRKT